VAQSAKKSRSDLLITLDGCVLLVAAGLIWAVAMLLLVALDTKLPDLLPLEFAGFLGLGLFVLILLVPVGVGIYTGYRTRQAGWLTGALSVSVWCVFSIGIDLYSLGHPEWEEFPLYFGSVVLGAVGGLVGQWLKSRARAKTASFQDRW
jgi:hypothetical protein